MTYQKANNADTVSGRQEFLVFVLNEQEYGIDILKVQEIRGYQEQSVTRIANVPPFVKGVTNLRGVIVPIIDMRIKFNLPDVKYDNQTVVVILNVADRVIGVRSEEHTSELQSRGHLVCRLLLEKKKQ